VTEKARYYILTAEGAIPPDVFVLADEQPKTIIEGCVLLVHEASGKQLSVHRTRIIPINDPTVASLKHQHSVCPTCGKVAGIVLDKVTCPYQGGSDCGLLESKT
jgi:hypothetical protein